MATRTIAKMCRYDSNSNLMEYPEAASQSFKIGELVYLNTSGQVTVCAANAQVILGLAVEDATGTTNTMIVVDILKPGEWVIANLYNDTAASAVCANTAFGDLAELATSSNKTVIDITATASACFRIVNRLADESATDIYPRVIAAVISTYLQCDIATVS